MAERVLVAADQLAVRLADPGLVVLDATVDLARPLADGDHRAASGRDGWAAAHVPGSRHLDLLDDYADHGAGFHFAQPSRERATAVLRGLGVRDGGRVVVYDRTDGLWAARAWWSLRAFGLPVRVLDGGLSAWLGRGLPVESGPARPVAEGALRPVAEGALTLRDDCAAWAGRTDVADVVAGRRDADLVCALDPSQFAGAVPTRYARRGHIPGSRNLPARAFTDADGRLVDPARIAALASRVTAPGREVIVYCGGGISAARTALALVVAGFRDVRVYDGSLEEWAADPSLPLVVPAAS